MDTTSKQTWMPTVGGILNIIAGVFNLLGVLGLIIAIVALSSSQFVWDIYPGLDSLTVGFAQTVLVIIAIFSAVVGILPLSGGIYALQRKRWGLVLVGSIAAIFGATPLGIAATILTALSKDEFN